MNSNTENNGKIRISMVIKLGGAYCAFLIGAGFATGQEIMQYYTSFGFGPSLAGMILAIFFGTWTTAAVMNVGFEAHDLEGKNSYENLCGKWLGKFLSFFIPIFMFLTLVIMLAGSGATIKQYFGVSPWVGSAVMTIIVILIVVLGLSKVIDTVGFIGPVIIAVSIIIGAVILIKSPLNIDEYNAFVVVQEMYQAASTWWMSTILYVLWNIVMGMPFMAAMGAKANSKKEILAGSIAGNVSFNLALALMSLAIASRLPELFDKPIPSLALAISISPILGTIYTIILVAAIFTTAVPLMWSVAARIAPEKSKVYYISVVVIGILGFFGGQLPFEMLINYVYPVIGYIGFIALACIIWREIKMVKAYLAKKND